MVKRKSNFFNHKLLKHRVIFFNSNIFKMFQWSRTFEHRNRWTSLTPPERHRHAPPSLQPGFSPSLEWSTAATRNRAATTETTETAASAAICDGYTATAAETARQSIERYRLSTAPLSNPQLAHTHPAPYSLATLPFYWNGVFLLFILFI